MPKLSPEQQKVVDKLKEKQASIYRYPGGYWTYMGCPVKTQMPGYLIPEWFTRTSTVMALTRMGILVRTYTHPEEWRDERVLKGGDTTI